MLGKEFDLKSEYEKFGKKYKDLPSFDDLNNEFELHNIDKPGFLSRQIRRRVNDKVIFFCRILENIIFPSLQSPLNTYEASFFDDDEKNHLISLHKKLMVFERESMALDVNYNEDRDVSYILELLKELPNFKKELTKVVANAKDAWQKELKEESEKYFG